MKIYKNHLIIVISISSVLIILIYSVLYFVNTNPLEKVLEYIWLNYTSNELEWKYNNANSVIGSNPLNNYYSIFSEKIFISNENNVYFISPENHLVLYKIFSGKVYYFKDDENFIYLSDDNVITSVTDNVISKYSLKLDNYSEPCYRVFFYKNDILCTYTSVEQVLKLHSDSSPTKYSEIEKKDFTIFYFFSDPKIDLISYDFYKINYSNITQDERDKLLPLEEPPIENIEIFSLLKINGKEFKLDDTIILSIVKKSNGFIINTKKKDDFVNVINNFSIYNLDYRGDLTLLYKNASGIVIWAL